MTTTRELINIIERHNRPKELGRQGLVHKDVGTRIKQIIDRVDLNVIDDDEFASFVIDAIGDVYHKHGLVVDPNIAAMYEIDDREDELAIMKSEAEIEKIEAQVEEIRSSK